MSALGSRPEGKPPFAAIDFAPPEVRVEHRPDGSLVLTSPQPLGTYPASVGAMLEHWAAKAPDRLFLAERDATGQWRKLCYGEALRQAEAIGQSLIDRRLGPERPVVVLSGNGIDHALLMLGCFLAGVPIAPVSPAYSLQSRDFAKLKYIVELIEPGLIYMSVGTPFAAALRALPLSGVELVTSGPSPEGLPCTAFADLLATVPDETLARAKFAVGPDTVAKILFTSGSTGQPKGVVNSHRMLCSNQQMARQVWPFVEQGPLVLLDWLPWNHTFGGNHNFNMVLWHGGTLYVDEGKPAPGLVEKTVANLRQISPTIYFNVPAGFAALLPFLEKDQALAAAFFRDLRLIFYAGAALPQDLWDRLEALSIATRGERVVMTSSWGSTETAPLATGAHFLLERAGVIGLPVPGVAIKLVPAGSKLELRVKGPNVTPGYLKRPDLTAEAFDAEGFYRIGDAGRLADPGDPAKGIVFDGRTAEDFKLATGTWVHVGSVRIGALAAASPVLQDAVVCGHDRHEIGLLAWANLTACRTRCTHREGHGDPAMLLTCPDVVAHVRRGL
ncbi:MAG TPA: feruloyl-CoA synthase, partial [Bradyrhizobium sp.]|nr:feruloyl-CoA synthase [Bradyrhizobium sp.]